MNVALLTALLFLQIPATPRCEVGQVIVDEAKHCCWPGQSWSAETGTCEPGPAPANAVPVRFEPAHPGDKFRLWIEGAGMPSCEAPCELQLVPDRYWIHAEGPTKVSERVQVRHEPLTLRIERHDETWRKVGIASVSVGGAAFVGGVGFSFFYLLMTSMGDPGPTPDTIRQRNQTLLISGGVALAGAVVAVCGGVLGFVKAGHSRLVPATPQSSAAGEGSRIKLLAVGAAPTDHGAQAGAVFAF
ncbi:MAG: hypothetical protein QM765_24125 [Myxococcales bacterium]